MKLSASRDASEPIVDARVAMFVSSIAEQAEERVDFLIDLGRVVDGAHDFLAEKRAGGAGGANARRRGRLPR